MAWWGRLFCKLKGKLASSTDVPLPVLVHSHPRGSVPPGPLEEGMVVLEQEDVVLHAVAGIIQSDGTIGDLPLDRLEWARRLTYRHLKREGCLAEFGIPRIPAYESDYTGGQEP
jgi:hypothetical protein